MLIAADTHVHVYPFYDREAAIDGGFQRLAAAAPGAGNLALCLTERYDCHAFRDFPFERVEGTAMRRSGDQWIFAGRQIVTRERLEVLALTIDIEITDGQPIDDVLARVRDVGGVPVLAWAPGKWFFERGRIVDRLLDQSGPGQLLLGDTSLRPAIWPEPCQMKRARARGFPVIAGSDPLPFAGEERMSGTYGIKADAGWDAARPVTSMRALLRNAAGLSFVGRRGGPVETFHRLQKNKQAKS